MGAISVMRATEIISWRQLLDFISKGSDKKLRTLHRTLTLALVWTLTAVAILPVVFKWPAPLAPAHRFLNLHIGFWYLVAAAICWSIYRKERVSLSRAQTLSLVFLIFLLTSIVNQVHLFNVDQSDYFRSMSNAAWQEALNDIVIQRSPVSAPHSYRFLPNAIVRWMQLTGLDYGTARDLYRLIFGLLLFYAIYKYARLYTNQVGGILAMVFVAAVYPVSFERYAGQLTDPMSHLSFALAFIFLGTGDFAYLLSTLVIGSLAKETVLAMTAFFVLFSRREKGYRWKASLLSLATLAAFFGVRFAVLHGGMSYLQVSGVPPDFIRSNWADSTWPPLFLLTACAFLPLLALGWKETPLLLKRQIFFLLPVLFLSGLAFSWLHETRNFMPLVFVSSVIGARYLVRNNR